MMHIRKEMGQRRNSNQGIVTNLKSGKDVFVSGRNFKGNRSRNGNYRAMYGFCVLCTPKNDGKPWTGMGIFCCGLDFVRSGSGTFGLE